MIWTISVGNLTFGGTGKTPILDWLLTDLLKRKLKPLVISRGYRSKTKSPRFVDNSLAHAATQFGDESTWLKEKHPDVPIVVGPRKKDNLEFALEHVKPDVILIDDGFQSRALKRDRDVVLVDTTGSHWDWRVFPFGRMREGAKSLKRATHVAMTKTNFASIDQKNAIEEKIKKHFAGPIWQFEYVVDGLLPLRGSSRETPESWILVSAIAKPGSFEWATKDIIGVQEKIHYRDHHNYTEKDAQKILKLCQFHNAQVLTTEKDATKLGQFPQLKDKIWTLNMSVVPKFSKEDFFGSLLKTHS